MATPKIEHTIQISFNSPGVFLCCTLFPTDDEEFTCHETYTQKLFVSKIGPVCKEDIAIKKITLAFLLL